MEGTLGGILAEAGAVGRHFGSVVFNGLDE